MDGASPLPPLPRSRRELAWYNFTQLFRWYRVLGIGALSVVAYVLAFDVFGGTDVTGFLPPRTAPRFHWPDLPSFFVSKETAPDGRHQETVYIVPTRQLTAQELAQAQGTNQVTKPAGR
jgi:hypothetical protein